MHKGAGVEGHFVNHQGRGVCITGLLERDVHPLDVCARTGHRDAKTLFDNYYKKSDSEKKRQTMAMMGSVQEEG